MSLTTLNGLCCILMLATVILVSGKSSVNPGSFQAKYEMRIEEAKNLFR